MIEFIEPSLKIIHSLLLKKGIKKYVILEIEAEQSWSPPPCSGALVTEEGKIYRFWFGWNQKLNQYTLGEFDKYIDVDGKESYYWCEDDPLRWENNPHFIEAKKKLGL